MFMHLPLITTIIYECTEETTDGMVVSKFFTHLQQLRSRSAAITHLLERVLCDEYSPIDTCLRLYARNLRTGQRIELLNSETLYQSFENISALEEELRWYQREKVKVETALFHHAGNVVSIMGSKHTKGDTHQRPGVSLILADDYWVFIKRSKQAGLVA
jgi:hypothetical protein